MAYESQKTAASSGYPIIDVIIDIFWPDNDPMSEPLTADDWKAIRNK